MASRYAFPKAVKELRFHLCQTTPASQGLRYRLQVNWPLIIRTFLQRSYPVIKKHNPNVPVLIREAFGVPARVYARYGEKSNAIVLILDFGVEHKVSLDGLSEKECEEAVEKLIKQESAKWNCNIDINWYALSRKERSANQSFQMNPFESVDGLVGPSSKTVDSTFKSLGNDIADPSGYLLPLKLCSDQRLNQVYKLGRKLVVFDEMNRTDPLPLRLAGRAHQRHQSQFCRLHILVGFQVSRNPRNFRYSANSSISLFPSIWAARTTFQSQPAINKTQAENFPAFPSCVSTVQPSSFPYQGRHSCLASRHEL